MSVAPCWITRAEAAGFEDWVEWHSSGLAAGVDYLDCTHPEHLAAPADAGGGGWGHPEVACRIETAEAMCNLDFGHEGAHKFASQHEIRLVFV